MRLLIVTAVEREAEAIRPACRAPSDVVIVAGIGRTNAAAATTESMLRDGPFDAVLSAGVAGALPGSGLAPGDALAASACVYLEEGIVTAEGHRDMAALGFPLGDFEGNVVPVDPALLERVQATTVRTGAIATVATCSGTDHAAADVVRRTAAVAEAMEGAAVVHAARRLGVAGLELRGISNTTGERSAQRWSLEAGLEALGAAMTLVRSALTSSPGSATERTGER